MATKKPTVRKASAVKMCLNCRKIKPLTDFYKNSAWVEQNGVDLYCKECAREMCVDKESMRKYCWENGRSFSDAMWEAAERASQQYLINNAEWLNPKTSQKRKDEIANRYICNRFFIVMGYPMFYRFNDPTDEDGNLRDFNPNSMDGMIVENENGETFTLDAGAKKYSSTWNGLYTAQEIEYLDNYYSRLEDGFVLDDVNIQDYARKVAKASLEADTRYNNMRSGKCTSKEWKEAQDAFDGLCKSANFAACQKKDKNTGNNQVLCEIIRDIEINHSANLTHVKFEPDDIDLILEHFRHTDVAIK